MSTPVGPYTPVVRTGDFVITSGQVGIKDGALVEGGLAAELDQAMQNLADMNERYTAALGDHRPARSAVAVAALPIGACVEIEAWAVAPKGA